LSGVLPDTAARAALAAYAISGHESGMLHLKPVTGLAAANVIPFRPRIARLDEDEKGVSTVHTPGGPQESSSP
jgi:hypothetical protein